ncbi:MAG TPA: hypothetical protein VGB14_19325 [Acidimicrobiales bacterium]
MTGRTERSHHHVVRAERFELVDRAGRVVAVLGALGAGGDGSGREVVGLELRDAAGSARAWLAFEEGWGTQLCLAEGGNQVLLVDLVEPGTDAASPGPALRLCDRHGVPVLVWRVTPDGRAVQEVRDDG